jgi:beta-N-acetylhexosaminidase
MIDTRQVQAIEHSDRSRDRNLRDFLTISALLLAFCAATPARSDPAPDGTSAQTTTMPSPVVSPPPKELLPPLQLPQVDQSAAHSADKPTVPPPAAADAKANADLERMAGQLIIIGFHGATRDDRAVKRVVDEIKAGEVGGVMYLTENVRSLADVSAMNRAFLEAKPDMPPFITLDEEGGSVMRLRHGVRNVPSAERVAREFSGDVGGAKSLYARLANTLAASGFTVNFGPVVDLNINPSNPIIGRFGRSFGKDVPTVDKFATAFISAHHDAGMLTALKHFPGHGSSRADSHKGFVDITRTWRPIELEPYRNLIHGNMVDFIMVGHLYDQFASSGDDSALLPASLSPVWIRRVLRGNLRFEGVVISDDLEMGAIRKEFPALKDTVLRAVNAGVDVLLFSNTAAYDPDLADRVRAILVDEAKANPTFQKRIERSYQRVAELKRKLAESSRLRETAPATHPDEAPAAGAGRVASVADQLPDPTDVARNAFESKPGDGSSDATETLKGAMGGPHPGNADDTSVAEDTRGYFKALSENSPCGEQ